MKQSVKFSIFQKLSQSSWIAILGLIIFSLGGTFAGLGSIVRLAFPIGSLLVGLYLYFQYPIMYVGFTWWLWFLTPLLRRIVDYRSGWVNPNVILMAPYIVSLISLITVIRYLPYSHRFGTLPFALSFIGVGYGFCIGVVQGSLVTATRALLDWLPPICFGYHILINWKQYPSYRKIFEKVFTWGVIVMGSYGIIQFLIAPPWDVFWLESVANDGIGTSFGRPEALGIRVWSTMTSPGPFAGVMGSSLLILLTSQNKLRIPAMVVGYLSFLLSLVRSHWLGWFLGITILFGSLKSHLQIRIIAMGFAILVLIIPLVTVEPFASTINSRINSLSDLENDYSLTSRREIYANNIDTALSNFTGSGVGNTFYVDNETGQLRAKVLDSGILDIFFSLGWIGAFPYLSGLVSLTLQTVKFKETKFDTFMSSSRAISISMTLLIVFNTATVNIKGMILWSFFAMTVSAHKYYQKQP
ncbi:MAG: O-antigen ligase domain-containing protein [Cyanobacteria bacterium J06621_8]